MTSQPPTDGPGGDEPRSHAHRLTYEIDADESHSIAVVRAVAALTNTAPLELDPLYGVVDPQYLDGLFEETAPDGVRSETTFAFEGCQVTVTRSEIDVQKIGVDPGR